MYKSLGWDSVLKKYVERPSGSNTKNSAFQPVSTQPGFTAQELLDSVDLNSESGRSGCSDDYKYTSKDYSDTIIPDARNLKRKGPVISKEAPVVKRVKTYDTEKYAKIDEILCVVEDVKARISALDEMIFLLKKE